MDAQALETELAAKATALRVTSTDIVANIASEHYFTARDGVIGERWSPGDDPLTEDISVALGLLTFCVLVLRNGFTVTGESACASPENFDAEIGRNIARQNAVQKIWPLMGYQLKEQLHHEQALRRAAGLDLASDAPLGSGASSGIGDACEVCQ